jgi:hypothetical protein
VPYVNGVVSVTSSPTLICTPSSVPENAGVLIQNLSANIIYLGGPTVSAGVTATGGLQIAASSVVPLNVPTTGSASEGIYGIAASASNVSFLYPG